MDRNRTLIGFGWGVAATAGMSVLMIAGVLTGMSPMPRPIPKALVASIVPPGFPGPAILILAAGAHLAYGGLFGAILATVADRVSLSKGLGLGIGLWMLLGVVYLPLLGWGVFGIEVTARIAVATLVLHLVYGTVVAFGLLRTDSESPTGTAAA